MQFILFLLCIFSLQSLTKYFQFHNSFRNTFSYGKITVHWLASGCQFYDVSQMFVSNATSGTGGRSRGRNPVDFLIKGKQFLNDLPRLVYTPFFFFRDAKNGPFL